MPLMFWIWLAAMVIFLIFEIISPSFFFALFAVGGLVSGIFAIFYPDEHLWQVAIFIGVALALSPFSRMLAKRITREEPVKANVDRLVGLTGRVVRTIDPDTGGRVAIEGEEWAAIADTPLAVDARIQVVSVLGTRLRVEAAVSDDELPPQR